MKAAAQPVLMDFAGVEIIAPNGWPKLTGRQWADIESALILAASNQTVAAGAVILDFEERIGTRPAHRKAVRDGAEALNRAIGRANKERAREERARVRSLPAPWKSPTPDPRLLADAEQKLASTSPKQRAAGQVAMLRIEAMTESRAEALRNTADQTEILDLAIGRGDDVEIEASNARGHKGRIRIRSRDGLESLFVAGSLTPIQYAAGMRYRDLYERIDPERGLKPMDYEGVFTPSHGGEGFAVKRSGWMRQVLSLEATIRTKDKNRVAVRALQEVAGLRRTIASFADGGQARARHTEGLKLALDVCAEWFGVK